AHPDAIAAFDREALRESAGGAPAMSPARELAAREFRARVPAPWEERSYTGLMRAIRPEEAGLSLPATTVDAPRPDHDEWVPGGDDPGTAAVEVQEPGERPVRHVFPAGGRRGPALDRAPAPPCTRCWRRWISRIPCPRTGSPKCSGATASTPMPVR